MDAIAKSAVAKAKNKEQIKTKTKLRAKLKKDIQKWIKAYEHENSRKPDEGEVS